MKTLLIGLLSFFGFFLSILIIGFIGISTLGTNLHYNSVLILTILFSLTSALSLRTLIKQSFLKNFMAILIGIATASIILWLIPFFFNMSESSGNVIAIYTFAFGTIAIIGVGGSFGMIGLPIGIVQLLRKNISQGAILFLLSLGLISLSFYTYIQLTFDLF